MRRTSKQLATVIATLAIASVARLASADPVAVKVTEVAGDVAYLAPGRAAGILPGTTITIGGREVTVIEVTEKTAAVRLDATTRLAVGDAGTANVTPGCRRGREDAAHAAPPRGVRRPVARGGAARGDPVPEDRAARQRARRPAAPTSR